MYYIKYKYVFNVTVLPGIMRNSFAPEGSVLREDEANDCLTDRQAVLDEQVHFLIIVLNN